LIDNVQTWRLRHAPNFQHGASGNVIRNSVFEDSGFQLHRAANWENLLENCVVRSRGGNKSYGSYGTAFTATTDPATMIWARETSFGTTIFPAKASTKGARLWLSLAEQ
jgi:hypothetical protein